MWTSEKILEALKDFGTDQNRKTYARHGIKSEMYGVSYGNLKDLKKKVKTQHQIAQELWDSGNHDARIFATMIADPKQADTALADKWAHDLDDYVLMDALSGYLGQSDLVQEKAEAWIESSSEWISSLGWNLASHLALQNQSLPDAYFEKLLAHIERSLHGSPNRTRYAMNNALIAIGMRNPELRTKADASAVQIGKVDVDHGETNCKTPDASAYLSKAWARKEKQQA